MQPDSPFAPAHDSFPRLLNRLEPDPETLWQEAEPSVEANTGVLVIDDVAPGLQRDEHRREVGILHALGVDRGQIWRLFPSAPALACRSVGGWRGSAWGPCSGS